MKYINFDREKLKQLKNCYDKAVKANKESFIFNGDEYQTSEAAIIEAIEANEYEFKADGTRF